MEQKSTEYPVIYHIPGGCSDGYVAKGVMNYELIEKHFLKDASVREKFKKPANMNIVLCHNYNWKPTAQRSLEHLGIFDYTLLGQDVRKWTNFQKILLSLDFLQNRSTAEYILHLDAADSMLCDDPNIVLQRFISEFDCEILFNAEKWPYVGAKDKYVCTLPPEKAPVFPDDFEKIHEVDYDKFKKIEEFEVSKYDKPFRHLNSGCYIGRRKFLIEFMKEITALQSEPYYRTKKVCKGDQNFIRELHRRHYPKVQLDHHCRIFQIMKGVEDNEWSSKYPVTTMDIIMYYMNPVQAAKLALDKTRPLRHKLGMARASFRRKSSRKP